VFENVVVLVKLGEAVKALPTFTVEDELFDSQGP
jgi:hypothetical protein